MSQLHVIDAREQLLRAALRCLQAEKAPETGDAAAEAEYADEQLSLAARDLTEATEALRPSERPVGWDQ